MFRVFEISNFLGIINFDSKFHLGWPQWDRRNWSYWCWVPYRVVSSACPIDVSCGVRPRDSSLRGWMECLTEQLPAGTVRELNPVEYRRTTNTFIPHAYAKNFVFDRANSVGKIVKWSMIIKLTSFVFSLHEILSKLSLILWSYKEQNSEV